MKKEAALENERPNLTLSRSPCSLSGGAPPLSLSLSQPHAPEAPSLAHSSTSHAQLFGYEDLAAKLSASSCWTVRGGGNTLSIRPYWIASSTSK